MSYSVYTCLFGIAVATLVTIPPWPFLYNRNLSKRKRRKKSTKVLVQFQANFDLCSKKSK